MGSLDGVKVLGDTLWQQVEALEQALFESERHAAWLSLERQNLLQQLAHLEACARPSEPNTAVQEQLQGLQERALLDAKYIASLEQWISRLEERAAHAEDELSRYRSIGLRSEEH